MKWRSKTTCFNCLPSFFFVDNCCCAVLPLNYYINFMLYASTVLSWELFGSHIYMGYKSLAVAFLALSALVIALQ